MGIDPNLDVSAVRCPKCQAVVRLPNRAATSPYPTVKHQSPPPSHQARSATPIRPPAPQLPPIRYVCPRCRKDGEKPGSEAGKKTSCSNCGQRIQLPELPPGLNKTLLAWTPDQNCDSPPNAVLGDGLGQAVSVTAPNPVVREIAQDTRISNHAPPVDSIDVDCPKCGAEYEAKKEFAGLPTTCQRCGQQIIIPAFQEDEPTAETTVDVRQVLLQVTGWIGNAAVFIVLLVSALLLHPVWRMNPLGCGVI
jgi:DNA-directed RNA polymerase subunit RPC12/RpoP